MGQIDFSPLWVTLKTGIVASVFSFFIGIAFAELVINTKGRVRAFWYGLEVWATETHFMLVCLRMGRASALKDYLAGEHGILIRDASNFDGLNEHFFRIAAQSREENDRLVKAIGQWLEEE